MTAVRLLTLDGRALLALGLAGLGLLGGGLLGRGAAGALLVLLTMPDRLDVAVLHGCHGALWRGGEAGRGDGVGVVRAKSRGERAASSQKRKGITRVFADRIL